MEWGGGEIPRLSLYPSNPWPWSPRVPVSPDPVLGPSVEATTLCQASRGPSSNADSARFPPLPWPSPSPETPRGGVGDGTSAWGPRSTRRVQRAPWHPSPQAPHHKARGLGHGGEAVPNPLSHFWEAGRRADVPAQRPCSRHGCVASPSSPAGHPILLLGSVGSVCPPTPASWRRQGWTAAQRTQNSQADTGQNLYC